MSVSSVPISVKSVRKNAGNIIQSIARNAPKPAGPAPRNAGICKCPAVHSLQIDGIIEIPVDNTCITRGLVNFK
jgi:hypothetical protein